MKNDDDGKDDSSEVDSPEPPSITALHLHLVTQLKPLKNRSITLMGSKTRVFPQANSREDLRGMRPRPHDAASAAWEKLLSRPPSQARPACARARPSAPEARRSGPLRCRWRFGRRLMSDISIRKSLETDLKTIRLHRLVEQSGREHEAAFTQHLPSVRQERENDIQ